MNEKDGIRRIYVIIVIAVIDQGISNSHTTPDRLGRLFEIAQPRLGVAYHYHLDDDTIDPFFDGVSATYDGPAALAQDLTVINVTPDQITLRQAVTDLLHETPPNPKKDDASALDPMPGGRTPDWVTDTIIH